MSKSANRIVGKKASNADKPKYVKRFGNNDEDRCQRPKCTRSVLGDAVYNRWIQKNHDILFALPKAQGCGKDSASCGSDFYCANHKIFGMKRSHCIMHVRNVDDDVAREEWLPRVVHDIEDVVTNLIRAGHLGAALRAAGLCAFCLSYGVHFLTPEKFEEYRKLSVEYAEDLSDSKGRREFNFDKDTFYAPMKAIDFPHSDLARDENQPIACVGHEEVKAAPRVAATGQTFAAAPQPVVDSDDQLEREAVERVRNTEEFKAHEEKVRDVEAMLQQAIQEQKAYFENKARETTQLMHSKFMDEMNNAKKEFETVMEKLNGAQPKKTSIVRALTNRYVELTRLAKSALEVSIKATGSVAITRDTNTWAGKLAAAAAPVRPVASNVSAKPLFSEAPNKEVESFDSLSNFPNLAAPAKSVEKKTDAPAIPVKKTAVPAKRAAVPAVPAKRVAEKDEPKDEPKDENGVSADVDSMYEGLDVMGISSPLALNV